MNRIYRSLIGAVVLTVMLTSGCTGKSPPVTFYTLGIGTPVTESAETACSNKGIGVGPISWPRYLDQPLIVTRTGPNTLAFNEFHRWGGTLQDDFNPVIRGKSQGSAKVSNLAGLQSC